MLVRQPKINFKMTVRADCAVAACSSLPLPIKSLAHWLGRESAIGQASTLPIASHLPLVQFNSVQSLGHVWLFVTPWTAAHQASLSITNSRSLFKLLSTESVMPSNHLIPLSSPSPSVFNLSQHQGLFKWVSSSYQVAQVLEFQLQHQSFQWIFRTDFF